MEKYNLTTTINVVPTYQIEIISNNKSNNENQLEEINQLLLEESKANIMIYSKNDITSSIQKI